ncbi:uncharacterized protein J3R85_000652 [Psidium guajava]|nr:uncharacterized protein J3R85_000652 [Psidium guajava]
MLGPLRHVVWSHPEFETEDNKIQAIDIKSRRWTHTVVALHQWTPLAKFRIKSFMMLMKEEREMGLQIKKFEGVAVNDEMPSEVIPGRTTAEDVKGKSLSISI